jgi:UDP-N-acetyl-D-glucosamine dehydrogenase
MEMKELMKKIEDKTAIVAIIGMGYVGLPLSVEVAKAGYRVVGIQRNPQKARMINSGQNYISDVNDNELKELVEAGRLSSTVDFSVLSEADVVIICVPTPLTKNKEPDVSHIISATEEIVRYIHRGMLFVLESTTYPGTTDELILPMLSKKGLKVGEDFFLAFSPERVDPGNKMYNTKNTPKIIGGITSNCLKITSMLYKQFIDKVIPVSSTKTAEMIKLLENTFRAVNIALVNEIAIICDKLGIDTWEVIEGAATKPFGFMPFYPGPGLGGHCIPVDPHYLSWKLKSLNYNVRFIELAGDINANMPVYVVNKLADALNERGKPLKGSKIFVLGVAYKKDIGDMRESPALDIFQLLINKKAEVFYHDPYVPYLTIGDLTFESIPMSSEMLRRSDCSLIVTDHSSFDYRFIVENSQMILDTRNGTKGIVSEKIIKI